MNMELKVIAHIHTGFNQKFGIPRQSGLVEGAVGYIVFEKEFRDPRLLEGIEGFDYLWLLWGFSKSEDNKFTATVRPPKLGGKVHMGVFATRAPYRPNNIGLSSVKLLSVDWENSKGPVLVVGGVDMLDKTPIYDIKPYVPYADSHPGARGGFADAVSERKPADVVDEGGVLEVLSPKTRSTVMELLKQDPRPAYDTNKERSFRLSYGDWDIEFLGNEEGQIVIKGCTNICSHDKM